MKTKKVTRYQCDFCRKKGYSASHMAKHELHCTLNPNRICRVCKMVDGVQCPIEELKACLPQYSRSHWESCTYEPNTGYDGRKEACGMIDDAFPALREKASNCPACIMAALRQSNIPLPMASGFDFTEEMKELWSMINEDKVTYCEYTL